MIIAVIQKVYMVGKRITIDESMIQHMNRVITFVRYTPVKPITHRIKVCL